MTTNGNRYTLAFKFQVVLEAVAAEGSGMEVQVAQVYRVYPTMWIDRQG